MARSKVRLKWNLPAFEELRREPGVAADAEGRAERIAEAAGDGFVAEVGDGKTRARAAVITATVPAMRRNARDNTLLRNLDAGK